MHGFEESNSSNAKSVVEEDRFLYNTQPLSDEFADQLIAIIESNLWKLNKSKKALISSFRRLNNIWELTEAPGSKIICAVKNSNPPKCVGGASIGPLHGLPASDGIGEIRDLVVDSPYRSKGIGKMIFKRCLQEAKELGYKTIYLETTSQMQHARQLFERFGFKPVRHESKDPQVTKLVEKGELREEETPCYFVL